jgi:hypothetical protein
MTKSAELTLDDLFSDPLTLSLMAADRVDPIDLRRTLTTLALRLEGGAKSRRSLQVGGPSAHEDELLRDCIHFTRRARSVGDEFHGAAPSRTTRPW